MKFSVRLLTSTLGLMGVLGIASPSLADECGKNDKDVVASFIHSIIPSMENLNSRFQPVVGA